MDPTFTPAEVQQILARLRAGESIPGWTYAKTPGGSFGESEQFVPESEQFYYDFGPTRRQGFNPATGAPSTGVFNPGEGYRRTRKYVEPLALAAFGTALGYGLAGGGASGASGASGAGAAGGSGAGAAPGLNSLGATAATSGAGLSKMAGGKVFEFLIPAAASLIGTGMAARSAEKGAAAEREQQQKALDLQQRMYEEGIARQKPFLETGTEFFNRLAALQRGGPGAAQEFLQMDPGYGFRMSEGLKALERGAAARGGLISGNALRAAQRFGQDLASQEFGAAYNRLAGLAQVGPSAAGVMNTLGQNYAGGASNIYGAMGQTAGQSQLARGSLYNRALNDISYMAGQYYGRPQGGMGSPSYISYPAPDYSGPAMPGMPGA